MPGHCQEPDKWKFIIFINKEVQPNNIFYTNVRDISGDAREDGGTNTIVPMTVYQGMGQVFMLTTRTPLELAVGSNSWASS